MGIHSWFGYLNENQCKHLHQLKHQVIHCVHSTSHSDTVECPCLHGLEAAHRLRANWNYTENPTTK